MHLNCPVFLPGAGLWCRKETRYPGPAETRHIHNVANSITRCDGDVKTSEDVVVLGDGAIMNSAAILNRPLPPLNCRRHKNQAVLLVQKNVRAPRKDTAVVSR